MESENDKTEQGADRRGDYLRFLHSIKVATGSSKRTTGILPGQFGQQVRTPSPDEHLRPQGDTAIIVCHGMGQQVPFETLNQVSSALLRAQLEETNLATAPPQVDLLPNGNTYLPRATITIGGGKAGNGRTIDLFEVYWAPLTEGRVSTLDVLKFLFYGGFHGSWAAVKGKFKRFLYGDWRELQIKRTTIPLLGAAMAVLISLIVHYLAFSILIGSKVLPTLGFQKFNALAKERALDNFIWMALALICILILFFFWWCIRKKAPQSKEWDTPGKGKWLLYLQTGLTLVVLALSLIISTVTFLFGHPRPPSFAVALVDWTGGLSLQHPIVHNEFVLIIFLIWALILWKVDCVIVEYAGDVAAYVSAYQLNKFWTVRQEIQDVALCVARFVYNQGYKHIICIGHSLGSVVAYDSLNAIIRESGSDPRRVKRTKALITFGSPLDKTAFLFREHMGENGLGVREALAMAVQPIIENATNWPEKWINIYSPADIIGGSLEYYQLETGPQVENKLDYEANFPLLAHDQYWNNRCFRKVLYDECLR